jgi:SAM-dependent methyltransferase
MAIAEENLDPHVWTEDLARDYDRTSAAMFRPEVLEPTVDFLADHAGAGPVAEFAVGTGRVALPLRARGVDVRGIEFSQPMVDELRRKPGGADVPVQVGDMATTRLPGEFSLVYLVFNTIGNLLAQEQQSACFQNAADHLAPGGEFVVELYVPPLRGLPPGERFKPFEVSPGHIGFDEFDTVEQLLVSHHYDFFEGKAKYTHTPQRYVWPSELDLMAAHAGLRRTERWADWTRSPFTEASTSHVSVWRK